MELIINTAATITAAQAAAALGKTGTGYTFETAYGDVPEIPGMTLTFDMLTGTPTQAGSWTLPLTDRYGNPIDFPLTVVDPTPAPEPEPPAENPMPSDPFPGDLPPTVLAFMGIPETPETLALARQHVRVVTTFVRAYTRGKGFDKLNGTPGIDIEDVIVSAAARYLVNPQQLTRQTLGNQSVSYAALEGFTLAEKAVLNQYRRRAS